MEEIAQKVTLSHISRGLKQYLTDPAPILRGMGYVALSGRHRRWSVGRMLEAQAVRNADRPALRFGDREWTYAEFNNAANQVAWLLADRGIGPGDVVGVLMETHAELLICVAGIIKLGAIAGMLNYNQREAVLNHSIGLIKPKAMITGTECMEALQSSRYMPGGGENILHFAISTDDTPCPPGFADLLAERPTFSTANHPATRDIRTSQPCFYIFTSGTTGLPKASVMSHRRWLLAMSGVGQFSMRLRNTDVLYTVLPFYHNNALTVSWASAMGAGACMALSRKFSASRFWDEARRYGATSFCYIGELCRYLLNQPPSPQDRQHNIRVIAGNGLRAEIWPAFQQRFGINRINEFYGASECNLAFVNFFNIPGSVGMCPLPFAVVACDTETEQPVVDAKGHMQRVATGETGLLITQVSMLAPFEGYTDDAASEKKLLRNVFRKGDCWFNTGDLVRSQGFNHIQFVDRLGDTFRWKGENVATTEIEAVFGNIGSIEQAVVYGVPVPHADGRAGMAALTLRVPLPHFDFRALGQALASHLPGYAVPLFVRVRDEHEVTGTFKHRKVDLKNDGFDISKISDPLYYFAGRDHGYQPLDADVFSRIREGLLRL